MWLFRENGAKAATPADGGGRSAPIRTFVRRHANWANLNTLIRLDRQHTSGGQSSREVAYFLSSKAAPSAFFLQVIRDHWAIENQFHWSLDVTFREDDNSTHLGHAAQNLALIRRLALTLLKRETSVKVGLQAKRMRAGWNNDYLLKVLSS